MEPMTMFAVGSLAISGLTSIVGMFQGAKETKKNREMQERVLSQGSNDMNLWKGIAMGGSGIGPGGGAGGPQMAAPGAYPWAR